ncbi:MAG: GNAT family N-acetyltransferase [Kiritimatiellae bacterium]|jgi:amino-acid N-acetyltransferase|nr:GNAT family N-acetyltransferase [Kiritimatiellia bacterium]
MTENKNYIIRPAHLSDAMAIFDLIQIHQDQLIPRPLGDIISNIDRFFICESNSIIVGCAAWQIIPEIGEPSKASVEIQSVAVCNDIRHNNIGSELVSMIIENVKRFKPCEAIVLTFVPEFFKKLGFHEVPKTSVMHKLYMGCINCTKHANPYTCPEIAMARDLNKDVK